MAFLGPCSYFQISPHSDEITKRNSELQLCVAAMPKYRWRWFSSEDAVEQSVIVMMSRAVFNHSNQETNKNFLLNAQYCCWQKGQKCKKPTEEHWEKKGSPSRQDHAPVALFYLTLALSEMSLYRVTLKLVYFFALWEFVPLYLSCLDGIHLIRTVCWSL